MNKRDTNQANSMDPTGDEGDTINPFKMHHLPKSLETTYQPEDGAATTEESNADTALSRNRCGPHGSVHQSWIRTRQRQDMGCYLHLPGDKSSPQQIGAQARCSVSYQRHRKVHVSSTRRQAIDIRQQRIRFLKGSWRSAARREKAT